MSSPSSWWCLSWGMPPGILPLPPRKGRALPPILVINLVFCNLEATQGCQRFFEVRAMPYGHRVRTHKIRTYPAAIWVWSSLASRSIQGWLLQYDPGLAWSFGTMYHERIRLECSRIVVFYTFGVDLQCGILDHFFPYRWPCGRPFLM